MKKMMVGALSIALAFSLTACGASTSGDSNSEAQELKIGQVQYAAHGDNAFTVATAVLEGDKIVSAYVDEYQVMSKEEAVCVPNSDAAFGENFADTTTSLASKRASSEYYSALMAEKAGSTVTIDANFDAIAEYCVGKTVSELETIVKEKEEADMVDAVSGATLAATEGYVSAIIEAAKVAK